MNIFRLIHDFFNNEKTTNFQRKARQSIFKGLISLRSATFEFDGMKTDRIIMKIKQLCRFSEANGLSARIKFISNPFKNNFTICSRSLNNLEYLDWNKFDSVLK